VRQVGHLPETRTDISKFMDKMWAFLFNVKRVKKTGKL